MARAPATAPVVEEVVETPPAEEMVDEAVVVATILRNADGTLTLESGDEPEIDPALAAEGEAPMPAGETFTDDDDGHGKLLTAVMNMLGGGGPADIETRKANMAEGFGASPPPVPGM